MLVVLCGDKGAPGVTTSALALASAWPEQAIVVEADPAGGDLAIRLHPGGDAIPDAPTVLSLAATARSDMTPDLVARHAHPLSKAVSVVPGAIRREQMARRADWSSLADAVGRSDVPIVADIGQLHAASPMLPLAAAADVLVVVGRPDLTSVVRLRQRLASLGTDVGAVRGSPPRLYAVLVAAARHGRAYASDLGQLLDETTARPFMSGIGFLAHDAAAVRRLEAGGDPAGRLARTNLMRTAREVVRELTAATEGAPPRERSEPIGGVQ